MKQISFLIFFVCLIFSVSCSRGKIDFLDLCAQGDIEAVRAALTSGVDLQLTDKNGLTPLKAAVAHNPDYRVVQVLMDNGADIYGIYNSRDYSLLHLAASKNPSEGMTRFLLSQGFNPNKNNGADSFCPALFAAAFMNPNPKVIQVLIDYGAKFPPEIGGVTLLHYAAQNNPSVEVIQFLVEYGYDVNVKDDMGTTPLMYAAEFSKNPEIITVLIGLGANVNHKNDAGLSPIACAAMYNSTPGIITVLLRYGVDINEKINDTSVLYFAEEFNNKQAVMELIKAGAK
jgi:ankyrin repeat protein